MVNRERFMLDVDSEGFPLQNASMASYNLGKTLDHPTPQAMLADHKCLRCANPPGWHVPSLWVEVQPNVWVEMTRAANPPGWQKIDGVALPPITWAERVGNCSDPRCVLYGTEKCAPGSGCMCDEAEGHANG